MSSSGVQYSDGAMFEQTIYSNNNTNDKILMNSVDLNNLAINK